MEAVHNLAKMACIIALVKRELGREPRQKKKKMNNKNEKK